MLSEKRHKIKNIEIKIGEFFSKVDQEPNHYTLISIFFAIFSFYFLTKLKLILALIFFVFAVFLDLVDGAVARIANKATKKGAYLDTICDRYVEAIILFGLFFLPLPYIIFPSKTWIFISFLGSLMTTYAKAAAKEKGLVVNELKKGFFGRAERMIMIFLAMFLGIFNLSLAIYPIILLGIFSNITALQRIFLSLNVTDE